MQEFFFHDSTYKKQRNYKDTKKSLMVQGHNGEMGEECPAGHAGRASRAGPLKCK